jgi:alkylation response protein AidB-like acyl-CoA dehydrogenase
MDFRIGEEEEALRRAVRAFSERCCPVERLKQLERSPRVDRDLWSGLAELGIFDLEALGLGASEAVLVFAELGRALMPGPIVWTHLAAGLVDGARDGRVVVQGVDRENDGPIIAEHLESTEVLLSIGRDGVRRHDPRALEARPIEAPLDPLTPAHEIAALASGELIAGPEDALRLRTTGEALVAAQLFGISEATLELAVSYAKMREQFGRPIGSFQAIKHIAADMFVRQELARAAVYAAGATLDDSSADARGAVSSALIIAAKAADKNARACLQIHGGMGYTWEMPVHYFLKRTWALRTMFGALEDHAESLFVTLEQTSAR